MSPRFLKRRPAGAWLVLLEGISWVCPRARRPPRVARAGRAPRAAVVSATSWLNSDFSKYRPSDAATDSRSAPPRGPRERRPVDVPAVPAPSVGLIATITWATPLARKSSAMVRVGPAALAVVTLMLVMGIVGERSTKAHLHTRR